MTPFHKYGDTPHIIIVQMGGELLCVRLQTDIHECPYFVTIKVTTLEPCERSAYRYIFAHCDSGAYRPGKTPILFAWSSTTPLPAWIPISIYWVHLDRSIQTYMTSGLK